ncbi:MAG: chemotaxis protein CheW [Proteobacteria bacterium]|nr:chemotaxis protein CheW [Pseudomonadota bacterium]
MKRRKLLVFALSGLHCALPLSDIEQVLHSIQINPAPRAPEIVMGLINVRGHIIPVLNIRKLFRLAEVEISLNDQIIVGKAADLPIAIVVDTVIGVGEYNELDIINPNELYAEIEFLQGVTKLKGGVIYIYNLDKFFSSQVVAAITPLLTADNTLLLDEPVR